jgi:hypothetical protein
MAARNVVATAKSAGFLGGADLVTKAAFDNVVPAVKKVRIQAAEAKTHALAAKTAAGQASYAQAGDDFAKSQTADAQAATSAKSAADAAKLAQDGLAEVAAAVVDATRLAGEALDKADKSHTESTKTADRREARALRREGSAKEAQEQHESARRAWQLRARMGVGHVSGSNQLQQLAGASQTSGLAAKQARQAADDAKDAANKAEDLAKKSRESGASLGDMGQAFEAEGKAGSATADAWSATGGKASQAASEHTESVVMWAWYTTTKGTFEDADRTGYTAPGIMGTHYEDIKTGLARENSPALEHEHPLQPRHVARFAEYIMKYKPGDLWEPVLK